jgi:integrase
VLDVNARQTPARRPAPPRPLSDAQSRSRPGDEGFLYRRGHTWTWAFTVGTAGNRGTISRGGYPTKKAAALDLADALARYGKGDKSVTVKASRQTLGDYLAGWLKGLPARQGDHALKPSTIGGYENIVRSWIVPHPIGDVVLADLDWQVLTGLYADLRDHGGRPTKAAKVTAAATGTKPVGRPLGSRTVAACHILLRSALGEAVEQGLLQVNPTDQIPKHQRPSHTAGKVEGKHWEADEAARFLVSTADDRLHALWALGLDTGARRGELLGLRWDDVKLDVGTVTYARNRVVVNGDVWEGTPKSGKSRTVDIGAQSVTALRAHRRQQLAERMAAGPGYVDSGYVFTDEIGEPVRPDKVNHLFRVACVAAGVSDIGPHGLRHTSATLALRAGVPLHIVSARLGHASLAITADIYTHRTEGDQAAAAQQLAAVLYGGGS